MSNENQKLQGIAIVPGSFDPMTFGHLDIIKRASQMYEKVFVAVMINSEKKYLLSMSDRCKIAEMMVSDLSGVHVISSEGWLWMLARELGAVAIVKGYRNSVDFEYETKMAQFNNEKYPPCRTVLLKANDRLCNVSSTIVREKILNNECTDAYLPKAVAEYIKNIILSKASANDTLTSSL